jgi:hypothetical protein
MGASTSLSMVGRRVHQVVVGGRRGRSAEGISREYLSGYTGYVRKYVF